MKEFFQSPIGQFLIVGATVLITLIVTDIYDDYAKTDSGKTVKQELAEIKETVQENKITLQFVREAVEHLSSE